MAREALKLPFTSLRDLAADPHYNPKRVSKDTIHRVLREADISSFILPKRFTDLTVGHVKQRKKFADEYLIGKWMRGIS